jgi:hypothetical protein
MTPLLYESKIVFDQTVVVVASQSNALYGVLTSAIHRSWAAKYGASRGKGIRYTPTTCFQTFVFPPAADSIAQSMESIERVRSGLANLGVTAVYNKVHDPNNEEQAILELRRMHLLLDEATCRAYGWSDVDLRYGFHETDEGTRWTLGDAARNEILDRLLELNHERHREEEEGRVVGTSTASAYRERTSTTKAASNRSAQMALTENNGN